MKYQEVTRTKKSYAIQRIDLLLISISGAGIYIIFEIMRFFHGENDAPEMNVLNLSGIFFVATIIVNFISQWTGFAANLKTDDVIEFEIDIEKGDPIDQSKLDRADKQEKIYSDATKWLNIISTVTMFVGIILLTLFNLTIL